MGAGINAGIDVDVLFFSIPIVEYYIDAQVEAYALPNIGSTNKIARLFTRNQLQLFGFINVVKQLYDNTAYASGTQLPIDGVPGSTSNTLDLSQLATIGNLPAFDVNLNVEFPIYGLLSGHVNTYAYNHSNPLTFTFIPVGSALDVSPFNINTFSSKYVNGYNKYYPSSSNTFIAQETVQNNPSVTNNAHIQFTARNANWMFNEMENIPNNLGCSSECTNDLPDIQGNGLFCSSSTYYIPGLLTGENVTWSVSPPKTAALSCSTCLSPTITKISDGVFTLTATYNNFCSAGSSTLTKNIRIGAPNASISANNLNIISKPTANAIVKLYSYDPANKYTWTVDGIINPSKGPTAQFSLASCAPIEGGAQLLYHDYNVSIKAQNICGIAEDCYIFRQYCNPLLTVRPLSTCSLCYPTKRNPFPPCMLAPLAKQDINRFKIFQDPEDITSVVVATKDYSKDEFSKLFFDAEALQNEQVQTIVVLNADGEAVLKVGDIGQKITSIDMSSLPEGNYNLQVYGNGEYSEQQTFNYSLGKSDAQLAEDVATNNVDMTASDAADRIEVMKQQLYKELRTNEELLANSDLLKQFFASEKVDDIGRINDINEALAKYDMQKAQTLMFGWQPTTRQSLNCQEYYNYFISYVGGYVFSQQDIDALFVLANSCPDVDGEIVFAARSLYNYVTQLEQDFSTACNGISARSTKKVKALSKIVVPKLVIYPNPSKGNFSIMFPSGYKGVNTVKVLDQTGKVLLQKTVISGVQNFSLNDGLANGVYTVQITNSITRKTENQKLIVNK